MMSKEIERLEYLCAVIPQLLLDLDEEEFAFKPAADIWSSKEVIGHLIDEATNNHQTLARFQHEQESTTFYDLHYWNRFGFYNSMSQQHLVQLWENYNLQLLELIKIIPDEFLQRECYTATGTLRMELLIRNYLEDLELHLRMIITY